MLVCRYDCLMLHGSSNTGRPLKATLKCRKNPNGNMYDVWARFEDAFEGAQVTQCIPFSTNLTGYPPGVHVTK